MMQNKRRKAVLTLADGARFEGYSFGAEKSVIGEVVFNTAMTGYVESLTDPSYMGQIVVMTYPEVGNYGVPSNEKDEHGIEKYLESNYIAMRGIIVCNYSEEYSHWNAVKSLEEFLIEHGTVGLTGIDTRALALHLRDYGTMQGTIQVGDCEVPYKDDLEGVNMVSEASCQEVTTYGNGPKKVVLVDCGTKNNIVRQLIDPDWTLYRVPWNYDYHQLGDIDGLFISNGPGDPDDCEEIYPNIQKSIDAHYPIYAICMGHQLIARTIGARIIKLHKGHRSHNQPVMEEGTTHCIISSQNHGYAVDNNTIPEGWSVYYSNLNDHTNSGLKHDSKPIRSVQYHPEACGGPLDAIPFFDEFKSLVKKQ